MKVSQWKYRVAALLLGIIMLPLPVYAQEPLVITVVTLGIFTETGKIILEEAYKRIGVPIAFKNFPGDRALILTNDGITDGELFRIDKLNETYPNLIQVPADIGRHGGRPYCFSDPFPIPHL